MAGIEEVIEEGEDYEVVIAEEQVETVVPPPPPAPQGPSVQDLMGRLEKAESELYTLRGAAPNQQAIVDGFNRLGEQLGQQRNPQMQQVAESYTSFREKLKDKAFTDPVAAMEEFMQRFAQDQIAPVVNQLSSQVAAATTASSRMQALGDPTNKMVIEKWPDEVERVAKSLQPGPDVYVRACQQVGFSHMNEIITARIAEATQGATAPPAEPPAAKGAAPGITPQGSPPGAQRKEIRLTPSQARDAVVRGMDELSYKRHVLGAKV